MEELIQDHPGAVALLTWGALCAALFGLVHAGVRLARKRPEGEKPRPGVAAVEATVFALLGLMIAFAFAGASERFQARRALILQETQAIGTAWSRLDLLPDPARTDLKNKFRAYLDARLALYRAPAHRYHDLAAKAELIGNEALAAALAAVRTPEGVTYVVVIIPPINEMLDVALARTAATTNHPPPELFALLLGMALGGALLVGIALGAEQRRRWLHPLAFALLIGTTLYVVFDLEFPRHGIIRVVDADQILKELRTSMG